MRVRCHTSQAIELASGSGRNVNSSTESPLTAGCTASRTLSNASVRISMPVIDAVLYLQQAFSLRFVPRAHHPASLLIVAVSRIRSFGAAP